MKNKTPPFITSLTSSLQKWAHAVRNSCANMIGAITADWVENKSHNSFCLNPQERDFVLSRLRIQNQGNKKALLSLRSLPQCLQFLKKYPDFVIDDPNSLAEMDTLIWENTNHQNIFDFFEVHRRLFGNRESGTILATLNTHISRFWGLNLILRNNMIANYVTFVTQFCRTPQDYEIIEKILRAWENSGENFESDQEDTPFSRLYRLITESTSQNFESYCSHFENLQDFLAHIEGHNFYILSSACSLEPLYGKETPFFDALYQRVEHEKIKNPIIIRDELRFCPDGCKDFVACTLWDLYNWFILTWNTIYIYKKYYYEDTIIGFTKEQGEKSFLALRDVTDENGNLLLLKGCLYSMEWKDEDRYTHTIDIKENPRNIYFLRSLHSMDTEEFTFSPKEREQVQNDTKSVHQDIDRFLTKFSQQLKK